ncbi:unnamed protein product, partial [Hapterophycus canaliculatus]
MALVAKLHPSVSPAGKQLGLLKDLSRKQDKKIFRLLRTVCSPAAPHSVIAEARCELLKKVGTSTGLGSYLKNLCGRCSVLAMGTAGFQEVCLACRRGMENGDSGAFMPPLGLLEAMVGVFPEQARGQEGQLAAVFLAAKENGYEDEMTRVLAVIGAYRHPSAAAHSDGSGGGDGSGSKDGEDEDDLPDGFLESLVALCTKEGTPSQAAAAVRALSALASLPDTEVGEAARFSALDALRETAAAAAAASKSEGAGVGARGRSKASAKRSRSGGGGGVGPAGVASLAAFAREFPREFERYEGQALSFSLGVMSGAVGGGGGGDGEEEEEASAGKKKSARGGAAAASRGAAAAAAISPACRTLCASIELAANCLATPARAGSGGGSGGGDAEDVREGWLRTVFALLQAEGQPEGQREMNRRERAELRLAGSTCVVRLCVSSTRMQTLLTPERWHSLAWTLLDPSEGVRAGFLREVCRGLERSGAAAGGAGGRGGAAAAGVGAGGPSTLRFMAYLCLAASQVRKK